MIGQNRFVEIFVTASKKTRIRRDTKGLYKKAIAGKLKDLTGFDAGYDIPKHPHVICDTDKLSSRDCAEKIIHYAFQ